MWRLSNTLDASFCVEALKEAIAKYGKPEIMNASQGSQFTGTAWIATLADATALSGHIPRLKNERPLTHTLPRYR